VCVCMFLACSYVVGVYIVVIVREDAPRLLATT